MTRTLFILNDAPYGTERSYNAVRLASALSKRDYEEVKMINSTVDMISLASRERPR